MSHRNQFGTSGYDNEGLDRVHHFDHTSANDPTWHDELDEGLGRSGVRAGHNPQLQRGTQGYDEIIYTEKVTKELDSQGHVLATNVERGGPRASEFVGNETLSGGQTTGGFNRGQTLASDEYDRTGPNQLGSETERFSEGRERVPGKSSLSSRVAGQAERVAGKATGHPNKFYEGEQNF